MERSWISASRPRAASSSGADFTSSSNCLIMVPIRITLAGSSTRSWRLLPLGRVPASGFDAAGRKEPRRREWCPLRGRQPQAECRSDRSWLHTLTSRERRRQSMNAVDPDGTGGARKGRGRRRTLKDPAAPSDCGVVFSSSEPAAAAVSSSGPGGCCPGGPSGPARIRARVMGASSCPEAVVVLQVLP